MTNFSQHTSSYSDSPKKISLGKSTQGREIFCLDLTQGPRRLLLMAGVHGDERESLFLVEEFIKAQSLWKNLQGLATLKVVPQVNPDGCAVNQRQNANGVDLNRNLPTKDWNPVIAKPRYHPGPAPASEIENQILIRLMEDFQPHAVISVHCWEPMINYNGPARAWAEFMSQKNGYRISDDIGYPTPGSFGTWAGWERGIPTLTLEVESDLPLDQVWAIHAAALSESLYYAATHIDLENGR